MQKRPKLHRESRKGQTRVIAGNRAAPLPTRAAPRLRALRAMRPTDCWHSRCLHFLSCKMGVMTSLLNVLQVLLPGMTLYLSFLSWRNEFSQEAEFVQHRTARSLLVKPSTLRDMEQADARGGGSLRTTCEGLSVGRTVSFSPSPVPLVLQLACPVLPRLSELITIP